jgi:hypothetical protein
MERMAGPLKAPRKLSVSGGSGQHMSCRSSLLLRPRATVIMAVGRFMFPRALGMSRPVAQVPSWQQTALANWPAIAALLAATAYGATASVILAAHFGFSTPRNWGRYRLRLGFLPRVLPGAGRRRETESGQPFACSGVSTRGRRYARRTGSIRRGQ